MEHKGSFKILLSTIAVTMVTGFLPSLLRLMELISQLTRTYRDNCFEV